MFVKNAARLTLSGVVAATALVTLTMPAQAATPSTVVSRSGDTLSVTAGPGVINDLNVQRSLNGQFINVTDTAVTAGAGCVSTGLRSIQCGAAGISQLNISTGDLSDRIFVSFNNNTKVLAGTGDDLVISANSAGSARLNGGDGDDVIDGAAFDSLFGQNGNDRLRNGSFLSGGLGNDTLEALGGNDVLNGNDGFDFLNGGTGFDDLCLNAEQTTQCEAF